MGLLLTLNWLRKNWWMIAAILGGPLLAIVTLLLVRMIRLDDPRQLPSEPEA